MPTGVSHIYCEVVVNSNHERNIDLFGVFLSWIIQIFFFSAAACTCLTSIHDSESIKLSFLSYGECCHCHYAGYCLNE